VSATLLSVIAAVTFLIGFFLFGFYFHRKHLKKLAEESSREKEKLLKQARKKANEKLKRALEESRSETRRRREVFEKSAGKRRDELARLEESVKSREYNLDKKAEILAKKERETIKVQEKILHEENRLASLVKICEKKTKETQSTLERIANMSAEEARKTLIKSLETDARKLAGETLREIEQSVQEEAKIRTRSILSLSVQRMSGDFVNDTCVSVVSLPNEEMKGRIIGREGRNIRALEEETGVDLIIDDTPEAVVISCFNPLRRHVAKLALDRLINDGRIHPARITQTVQRVRKEFNQTFQESGEQACFDVGLTDLPPELVIMLGKLKYSSTGQQTVLLHLVETAHICGVMAAELGVNIKQAKLAGLLHDIGKVLDHETEGDHATLSANLCEKYEIQPDIVEAVSLHHEETLTNCLPLSVVLHTANRLASNRPGVRKEKISSYFKRLADMEEIAKSYEGVESAHVFQAGRELRVLVNPLQLGDQNTVDLSNDLSLRLRQELTFPGQVKITVIRENTEVNAAT